MAEERFSKREAIRFGWEAMKKNLVFFILFLIAAWILTGIFSSFGYPVWGPHHSGSRLLFNILNFLVSTFVSIAVTKIGLRLSSAPGETARIEDTWSGYTRYLDYLVGSILYTLIVIGGFILLVVPGVIWAIKYSMFGYLIIDKELPPVAAIKKSGEITAGSKWELFKLGLLFLGIILLGAICFGVGLFAAFPTVMVAHAYVYRKLVGSAPAAVAASAGGVPSMENAASGENATSGENASSGENAMSGETATSGENATSGGNGGAAQAGESGEAGGTGRAGGAGEPEREE